MPKIKSIKYTGNNHVFEIEFDNNEKIPVTMSHKFLCIDNNYYTVKEIFKNNLEIIGV